MKTNCNICQSSENKKLYKITNFATNFRIVKCSNCNFVFINPQPTVQKINGFYNKEYYLGTADYVYEDERTDKKLLQNYKEKVQSFKKLKEKGRLLDIGCAFGMFLKTASKYYDCYGVEISKYASGYAKKQKLKIFNGTLKQASYPDNYFDIINMVEVIEHLPDPKETIKEIYRIMKPNGILFIKTSNIDSFYARIKGKNWNYLLPGHLSYFSIKTLNNLLKSSGFKMIYINQILSIREIVQNFGIQAYIMSLFMSLRRENLTNNLIRGMTFIVKK